MLHSKILENNSQQSKNHGRQTWPPSSAQVLISRWAVLKDVSDANGGVLPPSVAAGGSDGPAEPSVRAGSAGLAGEWA